MIFNLYLTLSRQLALPMPSLLRLLAIGKVENSKQTLELALCRSLGVVPQQDWPLAPLSWLGEGNDASGCYWLRADPVHLVLQRDCFSLSDPVPLAVMPQQAQALVSSLNQHFALEGLLFHIGNSGRWYVRLTMSPAIHTSLPEAVINRDISQFMPQGKDAARWARLLNEIQMLLFEHPVNQEREARGEQTVNSLWFSGGGVLVDKLDASDLTIYAHDALTKGLARVAHLPCLAVPENAVALDKTQSNIIVVLDNPAEVERAWFAPLLQSLRHGQIAQLGIHLAVQGQLLQVLVKPADGWKFWRKTRPLEDYYHG
jgi:hypothetical protein